MSNHTQEFQAIDAGSGTTEDVREEMLNVRDAARTLGLHENTVRNLEKKGQLKAVRLPGSGFRRFRRKDVETLRASMFAQFAPDTEVGQQRDDMPTEILRSPSDYHDQ